MFKLLHNCAHFICQQGNKQNPFKLDFSSMWTENCLVYKLGFEKAEEPEFKLLTYIESQEKKSNFKK